MGLFGGLFKKKKKELPPLELPEFGEKDEAVGMESLPPLPEIASEEPKKGEEIEVFDIPAEEEAPETAEPEETVTAMPQTRRAYVDMEELFVKSDDYAEIMRNIKEVRAKINESDKIFVDIEELKSQSDKEHDKVRNQIEDIQRKLVYIDKTVFGG